LTGLLPFDQIESLSAIGTLEKDTDLKYVRPIAQGTTFESLLSSFPKKYRYNLRYDHRKIIEQGAVVTWTDTNDPAFFDVYVTMKDHVFKEGGKDENYYADKRRAETFRRIISSARAYKVRVMQITIEDKLAGIDIVFIYNNTYYLIGGAYDTKRFPGVGTAALYLLFEDAIKENATLIDSLQEDDGWKHRYFEGRPLYIFKVS
jgi:CelD/BcsL family acetyltransferase involved in cellulose biosynthesis